MSDRRLVLLGTRYPDISRMTRWRIEQEPDFPAPVIVRKRKYYYLDELEAYEEAHRRLTPKESVAEEAT